MASTQSTQKGQYPLPCQLCETEIKIQWKCMDCDLLMCDKCRDKIHPKFKKAKDHKILNIREVGQHGDERKVDFTDIKCKDHDTQTCFMFCKTCNQLVCPKCIVSLHKKHDLTEIKDAYNLKMRNMTLRKEKLEKDKSKVLEHLATLKSMETRENQNFDQTKQDILQQKEMIGNLSDQYATKLTEKLTKQLSKLQLSYSKEENRIHDAQLRLEAKIQEIDDAKSLDIETFLEEADNIGTFTDEIISVNLQHENLLQFHRGEFKESNFGTLKRDIDNDQNEDTVGLKATKVFTTELCVVAHIIYNPDNTFWIFNDVDLVIQRVTLENDTCKVLSTFNMSNPIFDMTLSSYGELIISDKTASLKILRGGKFQESNYFVGPLHTTRAIHITKNNKLVIGVVGTETVDFKFLGGGFLKVMNMEGHQEAVYEEDKNRQPLFTLPRSITSTKEDHIVVIDQQSPDVVLKGRIVVVKDQNTYFIYTGNPNINTKNHAFRPVEVKMTDKNHILVMDMYNNTIHILSSTGSMITYCNTMEAGILGPFCMAIIEPGYIYIGCSTPLISLEKAKIYLAELPKY